MQAMALEELDYCRWRLRNPHRLRFFWFGREFDFDVSKIRLNQFAILSLDETGSDYSSASDGGCTIYSFGIVIVALWSRRCGEENPVEQKEAIRDRLKISWSEVTRFMMKEGVISQAKKLLRLENVAPGYFFQEKYVSCPFLNYTYRLLDFYFLFFGLLILKCILFLFFKTFFGCIFYFGFLTYFCLCCLFGFLRLFCGCY